MFRTNHLGNILPINFYMFLSPETQFILTLPNNPIFHYCSKISLAWSKILLLPFFSLDHISGLSSFHQKKFFYQILSGIMSSHFEIKVVYYFLIPFLFSRYSVLFIRKVIVFQSFCIYFFKKLLKQRFVYIILFFNMIGLERII